MSMSVCFEFTPVSNIIPAFATLGSLQKEIMFLNWFLNDLQNGNLYESEILPLKYKKCRF